MNNEGEVAQLFKATNPYMVEDSVWSSNGTDSVVSFPVETPPTSKFKSDLLGVKQLEFVKKAQQFWVEYGTNVEQCVDPALRHNVSNTITVDDWDEVTEYVFANRAFFAGISFLAATGDKAYAQAPFTEVFTSEQIMNKYGVASMFASGLVVDGLDAFAQNLWAACQTVTQGVESLGEMTHTNLSKHDWVRRANKFAATYFNDDIDDMISCLKDVYNLHRWEKITRNIKNIDWVAELGEKEYTDIDTLGAVACSGGACEI
jgi:ribonucleoside-triphosphate reductase